MDSGHPTFPTPELQAVVNMTVRKAETIVAEYERIDNWVIQAEANIQAARDRQDVLRALYEQCVGTAQLFGFNLEHEREQATASSEPISSILSETDIPDRRQSIREIILDLGREGVGQPLKAATLRAAVEARYGKEVHDKTVGMTLYRLSKEGAFVRRGYEWYFVPEAERLRTADGPESMVTELLRQSDAANRKPPE